ncbi:MAG: hypothetical protein R3232_04010, partial [Clostridia bacterium]|nr:hypothetical protein [Clostridia bacterium]
MLHRIYKDKLEKKTHPGMYDIFPMFTDRKTWEGLDENLRKHIISDAEGLIGYNWPRFLAT